MALIELVDYKDTHRVKLLSCLISSEKNSTVFQKCYPFLNYKTSSRDTWDQNNNRCPYFVALGIPTIREPVCIVTLFYQGMAAQHSKDLTMAADQHSKTQHPEREYLEIVEATSYAHLSQLIHVKYISLSLFCTTHCRDRCTVKLLKKPHNEHILIMQGLFLLIAKITFFDVLSLCFRFHELKRQ